MRRLLLLLAVAVFPCWACRSQPVSERGITLVIEAPPDSLDDRLALSANGQRLAQLIAPGLVTFDDRGEAVPDLAESFTRLDDRTWQFVLRPNLRFHDGTALTSEDVKATYEGMLSKELKSPKADKYRVIDRVEVLDDRTLKLHLKTAYAPLLAELSLSILPSERAGSATLQGSSPVGAGAFRFSAWPDEEHLELLPYEGFWRGAPKMKALHVRVVRDETTRVLELLKGRADIVINALSPAVLPALKDGNVQVVTAPGMGFAYIGFNAREGSKAADVRVRRAICHAIDVKPIIDAKFHGLAVEADGMLPRTHWAYQATEGCGFDLAKARALLDEAGYPDPDGDGPRPRLTLSYKTSTDRFRKSIALVFKEQLLQAGIVADVRALEFGTFFSDIRKGNFELMSMKWATVVEPDLLRQVYASNQIPTAENNWSGFNRGGFKDPMLDAVLEKALTAPHDERKTLYAQAQDRIAEELPYAPLWHESSVAAVSSRLRGFVPNAHGNFRPLESSEEVSAQ